MLEDCCSLQYFRKNIEIHVIDDEEYEKKEIFYVVLGEPKVVKNEDDDSGAGNDVGYDAEKERLEELGKPRLGKVLHFYETLFNLKIQLSHKKTAQWYFEITVHRYIKIYKTPCKEA